MRNAADPARKTKAKKKKIHNILGLLSIKLSWILLDEAFLGSAAPSYII
jgi:hypothetical protein